MDKQAIRPHPTPTTRNICVRNLRQELEREHDIPCVEHGLGVPA
jgi:hypothetical protein